MADDILYVDILILTISFIYMFSKLKSLEIRMAEEEKTSRDAINELCDINDEIGGEVDELKTSILEIKVEIDKLKSLNSEIVNVQ